MLLHGGGLAKLGSSLIILGSQVLGMFLCLLIILDMKSNGYKMTNFRTLYLCKVILPSQFSQRHLKAVFGG